MLDIPNKIPKVMSPSESNGHIQVIFGPMFSGKTTELIRRLKKYQIANHKCLIVRYPHDSRYGESGIKTHDKQSLSAVSINTLYELKDEALKHSVIGIDEGQFFPDIVSFSEEMANIGKIIIIAALDGTYQRKGFSNILQLIPLAESIIKLNSVCMLCYEDASYTKRIGNETKVEVIGGTDKYMAVCRACYNDTPPESKQTDEIKAQTITMNNTEKENTPAEME